MLLKEKHCKDWLAWEPEVLLSYVPEVKFYVPRNKILAVQAVGANADLVCSDHVGFESVGNCFCNYHYLVGESQPLGIEECFYTINQVRDIISKVHNLSQEKIEFLGEIPGYIASVAKLYKHRVLPKPLSFSQDILNFLYPNTKENNISDLLYIAEEIDKASLPDSLDELRKLLDNVDPDSTHGVFVGWLIGCYVYDPTTLLEPTVETN